MDFGTALDRLGLGLSKLLRYSFGGFLLLVVAAVVNPDETGKILDVMPWQLSALSAIVVGVGIYAAHRSLIIPAHHLGLCWLLWIWERTKRTRGTRGVAAIDSVSPTRWLGSDTIGIPLGRRMFAYTLLRQSDFFSEDERKKLDVAHAESGLVVMMTEGLVAAWVFTMLYSDKSQLDWLPLCILTFVSLVASYPRPIGLHIVECIRFRTNPGDVKDKLRDFGLL